ncbi:MAG: adenylyl-sulfate kinase [Sideroxyarcus sp.]|nr:adenylyl-sulfate kinase [Sideroxyarcus sp.]
MSSKPTLHSRLPTPPASDNIVWHHATVTRAHREAQNGHRGVNIWFTGLSGSGKSTLAHAVEESLHQRGCRTFVPDGGNVRHGLCGDLGFSARDRQENIRRIGEIAEFTGISSPYEAPELPESTVNTGAAELDACMRQVIDEITQRGIITTTVPLTAAHSPLSGI